MAQNAALTTGFSSDRVRVRTPGKYVVLFLFAPVMIVAFGAGIWLNVMEHRSAVAALEYRKTASGVRTAYFSLPDFLVDLSPDANGRTAYMKMRVSIVLRDVETNETAKQIQAMQPAVVERITFLLRELRPEDLAGSDGMARVKREMLRRVNLVIAPSSADEIIIEELVIQ